MGSVVMLEEVSFNSALNTLIVMILVALAAWLRKAVKKVGDRIDQRLESWDHAVIQSTVVTERLTKHLEEHERTDGQLREAGRQLREIDRKVSALPEQVAGSIEGEGTFHIGKGDHGKSD
jgi:hypothetical protein